MNAEDYVKWANEYAEEAEMVERIINKRKKEAESGGTYEKMMIYKSIKRLESQKAHCLVTAHKLEEKAMAIKKREEQG